MPVDSLIGPTSPPSPKQRLSPTIYPKHTFLLSVAFTPTHFHFLPPKGAFYFYYKILILFDDRHLTVPLPLISLSLSASSSFISLCCGVEAIIIMHDMIMSFGVGGL